MKKILIKIAFWIADKYGYYLISPKNKYTLKRSKIGWELFRNGIWQYKINL